MRHTFLLYVLTIGGTIATAFGQANGEILNNKLVVDMVKGGLSNQTIITKISSSTCRFDLSTPSLISLKKAGVPEDIINEMVNTASVKKQLEPAAAMVTPGTAKIANEPALKIELLNHIHVLNGKTPAPLEKSLATTKTKMKAFGYGGTNFVLEISGATSSTQLSPENARAFIIRTGAETAPDIVLYKLKVNKNNRQAITSKFNLGGMQGSEGGLTVNFGKIGEGVYEITFPKPLEKGEYFFQSRGMTNQSINAEVFPFSIM